MARRKKYKDGEIEHEFSLFCFYHKIVTIQIVLKSFGDKGVFDHYLFKKYSDIEGTDDERAEAIAELLTEQHDNGDDSEVNTLYDFCWDKLVPIMHDSLNYTEGETVKSLFY